MERMRCRRVMCSVDRPEKDLIWSGEDDGGCRCSQAWPRHVKSSINDQDLPLTAGRHDDQQKPSHAHRLLHRHLSRPAQTEMPVRYHAHTTAVTTRAGPPKRSKGHPARHRYRHAEAKACLSIGLVSGFFRLMAAGEPFAVLALGPATKGFT